MEKRWQKFWPNWLPKTFEADSLLSKYLKDRATMAPEKAALSFYGLKGKVKKEEIVEWCKENMAAYKRPRAVEYRKELPKSGAGKILRRISAEEEKKKVEGVEKKRNDKVFIKGRQKRGGYLLCETI
jgi:hypothetical protein